MLNCHFESWCPKSQWLRYKVQSWRVRCDVDVCQVNCCTVKSNVVINFDFWRGWNSIISSNGGRQISLFERQNFNEGNLFNFLFLDERTSYMTVSYSGQKKGGERNVKFRRSGTLKIKGLLMQFGSSYTILGIRLALLCSQFSWVRNWGKILNPKKSSHQLWLSSAC